tara:strand:+ start:406 stop:1845 length:1440 start_codon:yes stop_codon:yes gene_type:complete
LEKGNLLRNSSIYILGSVTTASISVFSLALLARSLSVSEYGELSVLLQIATLFAFIFGLELSASVVIEYNLLGVNSDAYKQLIGSLFIFSFLFFLTSAVILLFAVLSDLEPYPGINTKLALVAILSGYFVSVINLGSGFLLISERAQTLSLFRVIRASSFLVFLIIALLVYDGGLLGAIFAEASSTLIVALSIFVIIYKRFGLTFNFGQLTSSLRFCVPLTIHALGLWALVASDRFVLEIYLGYEEVGIYSFGYAIAAFLVMITSGIDSAWSPIFLEVCEHNENSSQIVGKYWTSYPAVIGVICLIFFTSSPAIVTILGGSEFNRSNNVMPLLILSMYFHGLYLPFAKTLMMRKKSLLVAKITGFCAVFNLAITILSVPEIGIMGAALSTAFSYLLLMSLCFHFSQKEEYMDVDILRIFFHSGKFCFALAIISYSFQIGMVEGMVSGIAISSILAMLDKNELHNLLSVQENRRNDSTQT